MSRSIFSLGVAALLSVCFLQAANAGPLTSAEVTKIINRVAVVDPATGQQPAKIRDIIKDDLGLQTGEKSRSELLFQDNTLTRIGAETFFSFKTGTRDMTLEKGSMLLQVPKGLGGATIHTAAVTAAITGTTIMMEYIPNRYIKVLVLEGSLRLSRNGRFGDSLVLKPGKMVIMRPDAKRIPEPVDVDIKHVVQTSTLVNFPDAAPLPSMGLIQQAIDSQTQSMARNDLVPTNLVMAHGTDVVLATPDQLARITALTPTAVAPTTSATSSTTSPTNLAPLPVPEPAPAPAISSVTSTATTTTTAPVDAALLAAPTATLSSTVSNVVGTVPTTVNNLPSTVSSLPVVSSITAAVPTTVNTLTNTITSLPVVTSITGTVAALPSALDPLTSAVTSPVLNSVPATVDSLTATVSALPVVSAATAPVTSLSGTLNSATAAVAPSTLVNSIANVASTPTSVVSGSTSTITSILGSTTTATNPITTTTLAAPMPQPISVTGSNQLVSLLSNTAPITSGQITISPTSLTSVSPTGTTSTTGGTSVPTSSTAVSPTTSTTTAVTRSTPPPVTTITSGTTTTLTTITTLATPTTTTTATPAPITTITSLFGRH